MFATEYWAEHLLMFLHTTEGKKDLVNSGHLLGQLSCLCQKYRRLRSNQDVNYSNASTIDISELKDERLQYLYAQQEVYLIVTKHLSFQRALKIAQRENGLGMFLVLLTMPSRTMINQGQISFSIRFYLTTTTFEILQLTCFV